VARRWIVFVHHLPAHPSNGRVKIWRRLQQVGAVSLKNAVHVLPDSAQSLEDFEWLRAEMAALGGHASIFNVPSMSDADERHIVTQFQAASTEEYRRIRKEISVMQSRIRPHANPGDDQNRAIRALHDRFERASRHDFFDASGGTETRRALRQLAGGRQRAARHRAEKQVPLLEPETYRHRIWVTRPRPGVDRFSSAWLIRRFIDVNAKFVFAASPEKYAEAVPFDMYQPGGFKHEGDLCTFEVLQKRFGIRDTAVGRIAEIVHDIDLKEHKYKSPHAATVDALVEGLRASLSDDGRLLEQGIAMFEALYQSFRSAKTQRRPRC
jgi:hypothetical protein